MDHSKPSQGRIDRNRRTLHNPSKASLGIGEVSSSDFHASSEDIYHKKMTRNKTFSIPIKLSQVTADSGCPI